MSKYLLIDTSTSRTSVAIVDESKTIFQAHHDGALSHGEVLPKLVSEALAVENHIDQVIVGMGPGPFTGLRSGIAFAQSFAFARGISWLGVCSLDAIAANFPRKILLSQSMPAAKKFFMPDIPKAEGSANLASVSHHN